MPDTPTFVVNDRRKFTAEGELRHDLPTPITDGNTAPEVPTSDPVGGPQLVSTDVPAASTSTSELADLPESGAIANLYPDETEPVDDIDPLPAMDDGFDEASLPPGPTVEQASEAARAYEATVDRLDTAMRAANPGGERVPPMTFERLVQSLYTQALLLLGGAAEPGETPRVDILGARQTIDMISALAGKVTGNLSESEQRLLDSALFDLHMGFLEITQALARQAAQRQTGPGTGGAPPLTGGSPFGGAGGPRIVR